MRSTETRLYAALFGVFFVVNGIGLGIAVMGSNWQAASLAGAACAACLLGFVFTARLDAGLAAEQEDDE
jgi:hypothetical protein